MQTYSSNAERRYFPTLRFNSSSFHTTISKEVQPTNNSIFQHIKNNVTAREAAEAYGLVVSRNGMTCCPFHDPFHDDRHPSMKVDERFHCFACGADGDVIDFVARYHGVRPLEAAYAIAADFGIPLPETKKKSLEELLAERRPQHISKDDVTVCFGVLTDYIAMLKEWQTRYAPEAEDGKPVHPRFTAALQKTGLLCHIQDVLLSGSKEDREEAAMILKENYVRFRRELDDYRRETGRTGTEDIDEW